MRWTLAGLAAAVWLCAAIAGAQPGDPSSRIPDRGSASEYWDLYARFASGERLFVRFLITNEGPGERTAVTIGHLVRADGTAVPFRKGKLEDRWHLSEDRRAIAIGKSILNQRDSVHRFEFESTKQGVEIELRFEPAGPATRKQSPRDGGYTSDVLEMGVPAAGWYRVGDMKTRAEVRGTVAVTHTWMGESEADLTLRRIEFVSLGEDTSLYMDDLTAPGGERTRWLAVRQAGRILYRSEDFELTSGPVSDFAGNRRDYPFPASLQIHNGDLDAKIRLSNVLVRHDLFEALPAPFRMLLSFRMRPHRVWAESPFEVRLRPGTQSPPLEFRGTGITSVTFLNPVRSPA